jgi:hypothetical protein
MRNGVGIKSTSGTGVTIYYPNIASYETIATMTGAFILHTNVGRTSNEMFKVRVHGYGYGAGQLIDFTVVGYTYMGTVGNVDANPGAVINYSIVDNGNDGLKKYVGIDASNNLAVSIGSTGSTSYFYRLSADYWSTRNGGDASTGWYFDNSTVDGFGWNDLRSLDPLITQSRNTNNVGIGTITPGARLDVAGTFKLVDGTQ